MESIILKGNHCLQLQLESFLDNSFFLFQVAENTADEQARSEGRDIKLDSDSQLPFLLPEDGYSCDIV